MKLKHWLRYAFTYDTTWQGQFKALHALLPDAHGAGFVVDIGANDGFYSSNSHPFIKRGWRALLVEPHPGAFVKCSKLYARNSKVTVLNLACSDEPGSMSLNLFGDDSTLSALDISKGARGQDGFTSSVVVQVDTLQKILERQSVPNDFDLLSIDTEGYDYAVIRGMDLSRFRPRVIITERNANDDEKFNYLKQHGYRLQCDLEYDTVWISPEYLKPVNAD